MFKVCGDEVEILDAGGGGTGLEAEEGSRCGVVDTVESVEEGEGGGSRLPIRGVC